MDSDEGWASAGNILEASPIPIALSAVFVVGVATWLRWWPQIIHEPRRVRIVPIVLLLTALVGSSWATLFDAGAGVIVTLVVLVCLVGFTEELRFRGVAAGPAGDDRARDPALAPPAQDRAGVPRRGRRVNGPWGRGLRRRRRPQHRQHPRLHRCQGHVRRPGRAAAGGARPVGRALEVDRVDAFEVEHERVLDVGAVEEAADAALGRRDARGQITAH